MSEAFQARARAKYIGGEWPARLEVERPAVRKQIRRQIMREPGLSHDTIENAK